MKFFLADSRFPWRIIFRSPLLLGVLLLLPLAALAQSNTSSGFLPGPISEFAGNGNSSTNTGSSATQTAIGSVSAIASDNYGNIVFAPSTSSFGTVPIYMVYGGGTISPILAAVTSQPVKGHIYQVSQSCNNCYTEGNLLSQTGIAPAALWFDSSDNLFITDSSFYYSVFKVDHATGTIARIAGELGVKGSYSETYTSDTIDNVDPLTTPLAGPNSVKADSYGNIYIADAGAYVAYVIYSGTQAPPALVNSRSSLTPIQGKMYALTGMVANSCYNDYTETCASSGPANNFILGAAASIDVDSSGNVYILDNESPLALVLYAGVSVPPILATESANSAYGYTSITAGYVYAIAGYANLLNYSPCTAAPCGDGGIANNMNFKYPLQIAVDTYGNVYIADSGDHAIRKISTSGYGSTIAGVDNPNQVTPAVPTIATDGLATDTELNFPGGIAFDPSNNLYIADTNYYLIYKVAPALTQTINFLALSSPVTYGVSPITLNATNSAGCAVSYSASPSSLATISSSSPYYLQVAGAGTIDVTASAAACTGSDGNYYAATSATGTSQSQSVTVDQAPLTVTASALSFTYPTTVNATALAGWASAYPPTVNGWVGSDYTTTSVSGVVYATNAPAGTPNAGTYTLSVSGGSLSGSAASDYTLSSYINGSLIISGSTKQSINFPSLSAVTYGNTSTVPLAASATPSGLPITYTVVSGPGTISTGSSTLTITGAGTIVITASQSGDDTYAAAAPVTRSLTVNPAPLTVTAPALSFTYGQTVSTANLAAWAAADPPTITGWVSSSDSTYLTGRALYTTSAPTGTPDAGGYTLTVAQGAMALTGSAASNYTFANFVAGSLTIAQGSQTISDIAPSSITYGGFPTITAASSAGLPVTATVTFTSTKSPLTFISSSTTVPSTGSNTFEWNATGVGAVTITLTQAGTTDYAAAAPVVLNFAVSQAPLDITAISYTREKGAANPTFTYRIGTSAAGAVGGFQNGDTDIPSVVSGVPTLTTTATQASSPGTYSIVVDTSAMTSTNYYFVPINGTLTVTQPGAYAITTTPTSLTIASGQHGQAAVILTPSNGYEGTITLTCGTLPANVTCTISPSTYTFTGYTTVTSSSGTASYEYPQQGTILINTTSATVVGANVSRKSNVNLAGFLIPGVIAGIFLVFARKRVVKTATFWSLCALLALGIGATLGLTSCGGSSVGTIATPGTTTITITGSGTTPSGSGTVTATVPLTVTIQ